MCSRQWISRDINLSVVDSSYHNLICVCACVCSPPITRGRYLVGTKLPSVTDNGGSLKPTYIEDPAVYMCKKESVMLNFHPLSLTHQYTPNTKVYNPVLMPFCLHCCNPTSFWWNKMKRGSKSRRLITSRRSRHVRSLTGCLPAVTNLTLSIVKAITCYAYTWAELAS